MPLTLILSPLRAGRGKRLAAGVGVATIERARCSLSLSRRERGRGEGFMRLHSSSTIISRSWLRLETIVFIVWSLSFGTGTGCGACCGKTKNPPPFSGGFKKTWRNHSVPEAHPLCQTLIRLQRPRQMATDDARCFASVTLFVRITGVID